MWCRVPAVRLAWHGGRVTLGLTLFGASAPVQWCPVPATPLPVVVYPQVAVVSSAWWGGVLCPGVWGWGSVGPARCKGFQLALSPRGFVSGALFLGRAPSLALWPFPRLAAAPFGALGVPVPVDGRHFHQRRKRVDVVGMQNRV